MTPTPAQIEALLWMRDADPQLVDAACERFGINLTAAAEVGEADVAFAKYGPTGMEDIEAATIERCAQVAEQHNNYCGKEIATAIRAMKDK